MYDSLTATGASSRAAIRPSTAVPSDRRKHNAAQPPGQSSAVQMSWGRIDPSAEVAADGRQMAATSSRPATGPAKIRSACGSVRLVPQPTQPGNGCELYPG